MFIRNFNLKIIAYLITGFSGIFGLCVGFLGLALGIVFISGNQFKSLDFAIGWLILIISFLYMLFPFLAIRFIKSQKLSLSYILNLIQILISAGLLEFLLSAIEVVSRP